MPLAQPKPAQVKWIKAAVFLLCLAPLALLVWRGFTGGLGANPIEYITHSTGWWTLAFLLITLTVTPLRRVSKWNWLLRLRRMLGLYAFFYASLHFTTYIWLDQFFDPARIAKEIVKHAKYSIVPRTDEAERFDFDPMSVFTHGCLGAWENR